MEERPRSRRSLCVRVRAVSPPRPAGCLWCVPSGPSPPPPHGDGCARGAVARTWEGAGRGKEPKIIKKREIGGKQQQKTKAARGETAAPAGSGARRVLPPEKEKSNCEFLWELRITQKGEILTQRWNPAGAQGQEQAEVCRGIRISKDGHVSRAAAEGP